MDRRRCRLPQRVAAPLPQPPTPREEGAGGCRRGAGIRHHHRGVRSKVFSGGRPSAGEASTTLPPVEDLWSPRAPLASPFPLLFRPSERSAQRRSRVAQGGALVWRYEARPVHVKKAQCLLSSLPVTLSRNNELGMYTPQSLRRAALGPRGLPPTPSGST